MEKTLYNGKYMTKNMLFTGESILFNGMNVV